jgi:hypothetical protein
VCGGQVKPTRVDHLLHPPSVPTTSIAATLAATTLATTLSTAALTSALAPASPAATPFTTTAPTPALSPTSVGERGHLAARAEMAAFIQAGGEPANLYLSIYNPDKIR